MASETLRIERRFHGPRESGNGGYVCGLLGGLVGGAAPVVRLRVPPPLERDLELRRSEKGVALYDGETFVAEARAADLALEPPEPPSHDEAEAASRRFRGFAAHPYPSCFVCGPERKPEDGLCIFPGPLDGGRLTACTWTPDASLATAAGRVSPEFLWAALDCPGGFAFPWPAQGAILLGELQVRLLGEVAVGERCVVVGWEVAHEGRKHRTGTALFGASGDCRGLGLGTWFEVD